MEEDTNMADIELPPLTLREHKPTEKPSIYDPIVKQVLDAGPGQDAVIVVPTPALKKHLRELRKAATKAGRSTRIIDTTDQGDGSTELVFQVREKVTRNRKKDETPADSAVPENADAA